MNWFDKLFNDVFSGLFPQPKFDFKPPIWFARVYAEYLYSSEIAKEN